MTQQFITTEQYGQLQRRLGKVARQVDKGEIPFKKTMDDLWDIVEGGNKLQSEMTVGNRIYKPLSFFRENKDVDEESVAAHIFVEWSVKMDANLGEDDGRHLLKHQKDIPATLRHNVLVFPDWHHSTSSEDIYCISWCGSMWAEDVEWLKGNFFKRHLLLHRLNRK